MAMALTISSRRDTGLDPTLDTNTPEAYSEVLADHGENQ